MELSPETSIDNRNIVHLYKFISTTKIQIDWNELYRENTCRTFSQATK